MDVARLPIDINGSVVRVGSLVRVIKLSGQWFDELPEDERSDVASMIGMVLTVEEVDKYGQPWVRKSWPNEEQGTCHSHMVALDPDEMECVKG